jgi:hypothetical protein
MPGDDEVDACRLNAGGRSGGAVSENDEHLPRGQRLPAKLAQLLSCALIGDPPPVPDRAGVRDRAMLVNAEPRLDRRLLCRRLRDRTRPPRADYLGPIEENGHPAGQRLALGFRRADLGGVVYYPPGRVGGSYLAAFRTTLVQNIRQGTTWELS